MSKKNPFNFTKKQKSTLSIGTGALLTIIILALTFGKSLGFDIPSWNDIGQTAQVYESLDTADFSAHYINVGKADAIFINCKDKNILIDAGIDTTSKQVNKYIQKYDVDTLDLVIASHPDKDHIGGMANIIKEFKIKTFWEPWLSDEIYPDTKVYKRMEDALDTYKVKVEYPTTGTKTKIGDMLIEVLSPGCQYDNTNDTSIVVKITYGKTKFLFTGDIEKKAEKNLVNDKIDLTADVIKIAHHGSKTSSSEEFLQRVNPQIAVISVGPDKNNLPKKKILDRLEEMTIPYYRTDEYGDIIVQSDGKNISVQTQK